MCSWQLCMTWKHAGWSLCLLIDQTASETADRFCGFMCYQLSSKSAEFHIARIAVIARRSNFSVFEWFSLQICCGSCWLGCCSDRIVVNLCLALLTVTLLHISPLTSYLQRWKDEILIALLRTANFLISTRSRGKGYGKHFMQWALEKCSLLPRSACAWQLSRCFIKLNLCSAEKAENGAYHMAMSWNVINIDKPQDLARIIHYFQTNRDHNGCTSHDMYIACPSLLQLVAEIYP